MACVCCFFDNKYQKQLKTKCFIKSDFKEKLFMYKKMYIDKFKKLDSLNNCDCDYSKKYTSESGYVKFCDDLLEDYKGKIDLFEKLFDGLIEIYVKFVEGKSDEAYRKLDIYFNEFCTNYSSDNAMQFCKILFRGRPLGNYDNANIYEYYHIPFSKRNLVGSQRFSIAGKPMLYLAKSIPTAIKELGNKFSDVNFSVYYPKYSWLHHLSMYNITNSIDNTINNCIYNMIADGVKIEYHNYQFTFSKNNADIIIGDSILFHILTFPVQTKVKEPEEYILPQMFTNHLARKGYIGLIYQSTKELENVEEKAKYSMLDYNYCFFVPKDKENDYNEKLLNCFYSVCIGTCKSNLTLDNLYFLINECRNIIKIKKEYIFDEYHMLLINIEKHIAQMQNILEITKMYYDTEMGNEEISLLYGLLEKIKEVVEKPEKFGIIKYSELR